MSIRIYFSEGSDPMITSTLEGLRSVAEATSEFLSSNKERLVLEADTKGSPNSYNKLLPGIEFEKGQGPIRISRLAQGGLHIVGSVENLRVWCEHFVFPPDAADGDHHHPDQVHRSGYVAPTSIPVIIEVRND